MSILSALKAKGAKGKSIEEAIKTLPTGGGDGGNSQIMMVNVEVEGIPGMALTYVVTDCDKTFNEIKTAMESSKAVFVKCEVTIPNYPPELYTMFVNSKIITNDGSGNTVEMIRAFSIQDRYDSDAKRYRFVSYMLEFKNDNTIKYIPSERSMQ